MLVLLGFGLIHFYLIWFGDILVLYAMSGLVAFLFRKLSVQRLVALGAAFLLGGMLLFSGFIFSQYQADIAAHAPGATQAAIREWNDFRFGWDKARWREQFRRDGLVFGQRGAAAPQHPHHHDQPGANTMTTINANTIDSVP